MVPETQYSPYICMLRMTKDSFSHGASKMLFSLHGLLKQRFDPGKFNASEFRESQSSILSFDE